MLQRYFYIILGMNQPGTKKKIEKKEEVHKKSNTASRFSV